VALAIVSGKKKIFYRRLKQDILYLQAYINDTQKLLDMLSDDSVIERVGLEYKKEQLECELYQCLKKINKDYKLKG
jgi:hypothetical protein